MESENDFAIDAFARVFQCDLNVSLTVIMCAFGFLLVFSSSYHSIPSIIES